MSHFSFARFVGLTCVVSVSASSLGCGSSTPAHPSSPFAVNAIFPSSGSSASYTRARITGSGFADGIIVRVDRVETATKVISPTVIELTMPPHAVGPVDITVATASGVTATLSTAFMYVYVDPPVVKSITPNTGQLEGWNTVTITGSGFDPSAVVTIDGVRAEPVDYGPVRTATSLPVIAPAHAAGAVDVVVTNRDGQSQVIPGGYTYAPSEAFDFNGVWQGFAWETNVAVSLTIQNNVLVSVTCGTVVNHTFSPAPVIAHGQFSVDGPDGAMDGKVWSPIEAYGSLNIPGCSSDWGWTVFKQAAGPQPSVLTSGSRSGRHLNSVASGRRRSVSRQE